MRTLCVAFILAAGLTVGPRASHAQQEPPAPEQTLPAATTGNRLEPGDMIRLRIWREENMSGEFTVDAEGRVVFPRLGPRTVTDMSPSALRDELVREYSRLLRTPSVEITFLRRIAVGGAVQRPAVYHIDPTMTVRDVVLEAGGPTPAGRTDVIELIRDGQVMQANLRLDLPVVESPIRSGDQLYIPERNWFSRNIGAAVGIGGALLSFAATMIILAASN
ncbi:MAG TPA: polysaccharide biosynthesis/export family protein [Longimicrobiales bacterium]|nr:polysaccharide biosynthesis/export family protein [Longimicrobiales bacterium]